MPVRDVHRIEIWRWGVVLGLMIGACVAVAEEDPWIRLRPVAGEEGAHLVEPGETLHDVAFVHRLGFDATQRLNPDIDPWIPLPGTVVRLPTRYVLPAAEPEGLVINVPEMRLYDFTDPRKTRVYAIAVGDAEDPTPIATFEIGAKRIDPVWYVPRSIRNEKPHLPTTMPPGEDNPLGSRWMALGRTSYGIHGTNVRWSIGRGTTHGCVRLYEDVMQGLFERIDRGTRVTILYEPFKWGTNGKDLFLEVHPDLYQRHPDALGDTLVLPTQLGLLPLLDLDRVRVVVERAEGIPIRVGALP